MTSQQNPVTAERALIALLLLLALLVPLFGFFLYQWAISLLPPGEAFARAVSLYGGIPAASLIATALWHMAPFALLAVYVLWAETEAGRKRRWTIVACGVAVTVFAEVAAYFTLWSVRFGVALALLVVSTGLMILRAGDIANLFRRQAAGA